MPEQLASTSAPPAPPTAASAEPHQSGFLVGCIRTARPKQWAKNVLVFAAPAAAGVLFEGPVLVRTGVAFVAFCLTASGTYFLNDAMDIEADRTHPTKRNRPVAAGTIRRPIAFAVAFALMAAGLGVAAPVQNGNLTIVIAVYLAFTISYSLGLKREPVVELAMVAAGFILRAVGGAVAANVELSRWFLIVAGGGSLLVVAGKRFGEVIQVGNGAGSSRSVLRRYTPSFLRQVSTVSAAVTVTAYCLWAFENAERGGAAAIWFELSIVPFVIAVLRYALISDHGDASAPEDVLLSDKTVLLFGLLWAICFGVGVSIA